MEITPQIFSAKVMHKRFFPKINSFTYNIYYLMIPLSTLIEKTSLSKKDQHIKTNKKNPEKNSIFRYLSYNKFGILSFYDKDYGAKDGSCLNRWIREILKSYQLNDLTHEIILVTMPKILGYVFNPVSFWFCLDKEYNLRAVLCEVNNTFGENHNYLCTNENLGIIKSNDWLESKKVFHVSPFLKREGRYRFQFHLNKTKLKILINFYNSSEKKQLATSLIGNLENSNKRNLKKIFLKSPLITFKAIFLIHLQALKLIKKGIQYIPKPKKI